MPPRTLRLTLLLPHTLPPPLPLRLLTTLLAPPPPPQAVTLLTSVSPLPPQPMHTPELLLMMHGKPPTMCGVPLKPISGNWKSKNRQRLTS